MKSCSLKTNLLCVFSAIIFSFLLLEVSVRVYESFSKNKPFFQSASCGPYNIFGWEGEFTKVSSKDPQLRLFIVGDSFTLARGIPEEKTFAGLLAEKLNADVFIFAGGAWGNLQQYLAVDKYIDDINPDIVILQLCDNDFINNSWDLEKRSFIYNDRMVRPYLIKDSIDYRYPRNAYRIYWLACRIRAVQIINERIERLLFNLADKRKLTSIEHRIERLNTKIPEFRQASKTTSKILAMIKNRSRPALIAAFPVVATEPYLTEFKMICDSLKIPYFEQVVIELAGRHSKGSRVYLKDGHFNLIGHQIAADVIEREVKKLSSEKPEI